ncbi:unnamed protein product [Candidula unifasciata]|uniref:NFX1-type zinc finger-containing protein 1 n=1 Tax=Candidula unifasciata TaxID=100452 RepID=A0A8S4A1K8_9EUPU|nr:unnamed protein product [Candidula unifasciata]
MSNKLEEPPDNFLELPILPTKGELQEDAIPFIRCAKIDEGYEDVHQYLDVQFRLLRQDFIIPLREGIAEFKKNHGKPGFKSSNLKFSFNVRIVGTIVDKRIDHVLHVDDVKFQRFRWENSKPLLFGSLLCLSKDNFETVIFATVTQDISQLEKGFIVVNFKTGIDEVFHSTFSDVYVMAETTTYFESYCHVLEGLKMMTQKIPLQDYIIYCKGELKPPKYLLSSGSLPVYDLSCLMHNKLSRMVPVLTTVKWPNADAMCLNESQTSAVQLALTKELAIIQGPPGTGKTYVGLKVMQAFIENQETIAGHKKKRGNPILVICYKNHALDQFLEGVLTFCPEGIVRVGGQSKSEKLNMFNLHSLKDKWRKGKRRIIFDSSRMEEISGTISNLNQTMELLQTDIVKDQTITKYMKVIHLKSFFDERLKIKNGDSLIRAWLFTPKHTTQSVLSQMVRQHLTMLVLRTKEVSKKVTLSPGMDIIQRAHFYCYYLKRFEHELKGEMQYLSTQQSSPASRKRIYEIQHWLNTAKTQILPDHQLNMVLHQKEFKMICEYSSLLNKTVNDSDDKIIENWILRPDKSLHQQLDDVQLLAKKNDHQKDEQESLGPDYVFIKEQNDRMVDADVIHQNRIRTQVKAAVNSVTSAVKRAEALGIRDDVLMEDDLDSSEWKTVSKGKLNLRTMHKKLRFIKPMTEEEESNVTSLWSLELDKRFALYNLWVHRYKQDLTEQMKDLIIEYKSEQDKQRDADNLETIDLLSEAKVIGMTTSGAARLRGVLQAVGCRIIVVEEAAEVLESHIVTSLNKHCKHLILIGDHQQLRPNPTVYQLAKDFGLEISLFERLIKNNIPHVMLKEQHRMRPEISQIMRHIYPDLKDHPSVIDFDNIQGVGKNIFFIQHEHIETCLDESMSKANTYEARFLVAFCKFLLHQDYKVSQITILATYSGQVFEIRKVMKEQKLDPNVLVTTVDNYQGEENDVILLSLVRSNDENQVGFLKVDNRVCVALSRARKGLFAIGNLQLFAQHSKLWKKIVKTAIAEDTIGRGLPVHCHNHPDVREIMISEKDFLKFPEGGCGQPCEFRLDCGHICSMMCHGYDLDHIIYQCEKPCARTCSAGHPCKQLCYEKCLCPVLVLKQMPCGQHEDQIQCHVLVETIICPFSCISVLDCGHPCTGFCGQCRDICEHDKCVVEIDHKWPCGHNETVLCYTTKLDHFCKKVCGAERECGHVCPGICGQCNLKGKHDKCQVQVDHQWPCGHTENVPCYITKSSNQDIDRSFLTSALARPRLSSTSSYACKQVCGAKRECGHVCPGICGQCKLKGKHDKCQVQVDHQWPCGHTENVPCYITKSSNQDIDRSFLTSAMARSRLSSMSSYACKQVCGVKRECGHVCPGICGQCKLKGKHDECQVQVDHQWPCGHTENVPCYITKSSNQDIDRSFLTSALARSRLSSVSSYACKQVCGVKRECGHVCPGICGQCKLKGKHDECQVQVDHKWPCGHTEKVPCYITQSRFQNISRNAITYARLHSRLLSTPSRTCKQICGAQQDCGHACKGICSQCSKTGKHPICEEPVVRVRDCGHSEEVPCNLPKLQYACKNVCGSNLQCGHQCNGICGKCNIKGEHEICKAPVKYRRKCGHVEETPCHGTPSEDLPCKEICGVKLKCGHTCKGTCSECLQGIVHVACQEKCMLPLPCGHTCGGFCSTPCLPCTQQCPNQCRHGACFRERKPPLCSHTCPPCTASWNYRCPHLQYTRVCSKTCNVKPCAKYCKKYKSSCQHPCSGLCGELCVCAKCDKISEITQHFVLDEVNRATRNTKPSPGSQGDTNREAENEISKQKSEQRGSNNKQNQQLFKVNSCGHVFYIDEIDKYVNRFSNSGTSYIPCPVCQIPIQNCVRFENIDIVRSRSRAVEKEKLQRETEVSDKQKADLLASQRSLKPSLEIKDFVTTDIVKVTNIVMLRAVSFQIKCAFVLSTILSVIKSKEESATIQLLRTRKNAVLNIKGRLTNQQKEEFITELLRCFWFYCLSDLDKINVPDDIQEPDDNEMETELKAVIKDLGEFKATPDILTRAEIVFHKRNKRIHEVEIFKICPNLTTQTRPRRHQSQNVMTMLGNFSCSLFESHICQYASLWHRNHAVGHE